MISEDIKNMLLIIEIYFDLRFTYKNNFITNKGF